MTESEDFSGFENDAHSDQLNGVIDQIDVDEEYPIKDVSIDEINDETGFLSDILSEDDNDQYTTGEEHLIDNIDSELPDEVNTINSVVNFDENNVPVSESGLSQTNNNESFKNNYEVEKQKIESIISEISVFEKNQRR
jgi:hypothetical protein